MLVIRLHGSCVETRGFKFMESKFSAEVRQLADDCKVLNLPVSELAFSIVLAAGKYPDEEVIGAFSSLSGEVMAEIRRAISEYERTGEYHAISSTGVTKDLSELMRRVSQLI